MHRLLARRLVELAATTLVALSLGHVMFNAGLERMPQHQPRVIHPAGVPLPPGEPLGQLALPRPPRTGQHHDTLQPRRRLQLQEQVIPADKQAAHRGQPGASRDPHDERRQPAKEHRDDGCRERQRRP